ncbi:MAG TPA: DNA gyrase subunit A, partial [Candidatus Caenarcaniphilales bacterium]
IIVTELPYQVNKAAWIEKIAELINQGRIDGVADLRDESDREGMRVVIELKREAQPQTVLDTLYKQTPLQSNFGAIMLALVDGQPRQMTLLALLQQFLNFREQTLIRRYTHQLEQAQNRLHLLEGLLTALSHLDQVIEILRHAPDGTTAKNSFQAQFDLSERQGDAILAMPLRRLTGLEQKHLQTEFTELSNQIRELQKLLNNRRELLRALKKELRALKRKHGDPRRTRIQTNPVGMSATKAPVGEQVTRLEITYRGYVRRQGTPTQLVNGRQSRRAKSERLEETKDLVTQTETCLSDDLLLLTRSGKAYAVKVEDIPASSARARGTPLVSLLPPAAQSETIASQFVLSAYPEHVQVILLTQQGRIKRLPLSEFAELTGRGLSLLKLRPGDQLLYAGLAEPQGEIVIATSVGRLLRFQVDKLPLLSRIALGDQALRLHKQELIVGLATLKDEEQLLLVSRQGYVKRMPVHVLRFAHLGEIGTQAIQFVTKSDALAAITPAPATAEVAFLSDANHATYLAIEAIPLWGKEGPGTHLLKVNKGEMIIAAV